jgi:phosphatidyl-myo-inositol dimannoside synthase
MKIFSLHTDAYGARGGIAKYNRDLLRALADDGRVDEIVALPRGVTTELGAVPSKITFLAEAAGSKAHFAQAVGAAALQNRSDLVLCGHINLLPIAWPVAAAHRAQLLLMVYGVDVWTPHPSRLVRAVLPRVDAVASISAITRDRLYAWSRSQQPSFILPNALERGELTPGPRDAALIERYGLADKRVLLTVGRLEADEKYKGFDQVIDLMDQLVAYDERIVYLIVGDGSDRERLERKAHQSGHGERVLFAGWVPEIEKEAHFRLADAYVMPGSGEGFGFVYLEALACGVPVVASRVDGSREAVRDGLLGEIVDPADPKDILRGILAALDKPSGAVPEGLAFFDYPRFAERCQAMIDHFAPSDGAAA